MNIENKKILVVSNIPTPYRIPLFNLLHERLKSRGIQLKVLFAALGYARRKWMNDMKTCRFDYSLLKPTRLKLGKSGKVLFLYSGLFKEMRDEKPEVVIVIGFSLATLKIWLLSFVKKVRFIIWSGAINTKGRKDSSIRRTFRRMLIRRAIGFIAYGIKAKEYLLSLGAAQESVEIAVNTTDTEFYRKEALARRTKSPWASEKKLLYIGHLTYKKRIDHLFAAVRILIQKRQDFRLVIVGDGPHKPVLAELAERMNISDFISFEGFRQKPEIPGYLALAACFLFPSEYDIWGLVLVEAMAAGVPCISSIHAGATHDLIVEGKTGFAVDFAETGKVVERINWLLDHPAKAKHIGESACQFIQAHASLEKSVEGFLRAIDKR